MGFVKKFGNSIPYQVTFVLANGKRFEGSFDKNGMMLRGLQEVVRVTCLRLFDTVLFTYYGDGIFDVSVFNEQCVEKPVLEDNRFLGI